jgi:beta-alanine degradation protein BauB
MTNIQDVMKVASDTYGLLMENDKVRVLEVRLKPGQKAPMHNHPNDHVIYVMRDAKFKLSFPDGRSTEVDLNSGKILWMEAGAHETENIGKTEGHNLVIELK